MKRKNLYATLEPFKKKQVIQVPVYYYQNGGWHKIETLEKRRKKK